MAKEVKSHPGIKTYNFFDDVFEVAKLIPKGRVTSYGAIAAYLGTKMRHEKEMELQALGETEWYAKIIVKPNRKKLEKLVADQADAIHGICPVDQYPAPDHRRQERKI